MSCAAVGGAALGCALLTGAATAITARVAYKGLCVACSFDPRFV